MKQNEALFLAKRCWDIFLIGFISAIIVFTFNPFSFVGNWLLSNFKESPVWGFSIIVFLMSAVLFFAKSFGFLYKRFLFWPCPHPIFSILTSVIFYLFLAQIPESKSIIFLISMFIISYAISYLIYAFQSGQIFKNGKADALEPQKDSMSILNVCDKTFSEWLQKEEPINSFSKDFFGAKPYVKRLMSHISSQKKGFIGIVGSKGIGKSSVLKIMSQMLETEPNTISLTISLWGCNSMNIGKFILEKIISRMEKEIFCLELKKLPQSFSNFVNPVIGNSIVFFQELFSFRGDALDEINELDNLLQLFSMRLVVCLEDVDRLSSDSTIPKDLAFLLDSLQDSSNIIFIVSLVHSTQNAQVISRVLDYLEWMPHLGKNSNAMAIIKETVFRLLEEEKHSFIFHEDNNIYARLGLLERNELEMTRNFDLGFNDRITSSPIEAIVSLIKTPRNLKSLLREIFRIFSSLKGEIDFCDMFVACAIRHVQPTIFFFIVDKIDQFRFISTKVSENNSAHDAINNELREQIKESVSAMDFHEMELLIDFLFPGFSEGSSSSMCNLTFQRLFVDSPTDYFKRFIVGELNEDEHSDQSILKMIKNISSEENSNHSIVAFIKLIVEDGLIAQKMEDFKSFFNPQTFYPFCSNFFAYLLKNLNQTHFRDISGFTALWRISFSIQNGNRQKWLLGELEKAIQISLGAANDLYYFWRIEDDLQRPREKPTTELRNGYIELGKKFLNETTLCQVLSPNFPFALYHFSFLYSDTTFGEIGFKAKEWTWLGDKLMIAAKQNPELILPQISIFLAKREKIFPEEAYKFTEEHKAMFGDNFQDLLSMYKSFQIPEKFNREAGNFLESVIDHVNSD